MTPEQQKSLLNAAVLVLDSWVDGDLAYAVRELAAAVKDIKTPQRIELTQAYADEVKRFYKLHWTQRQDYIEGYASLHDAIVDTLAPVEQEG